MSKNRSGAVDIKAVQFELWQICNNNCKFCYLNHGRVFSTPEKMIQNIQQVKQFITDQDKMKSYNCIGLIGGEFFQGQLSTEMLKKEFLGLISTMNEQIINKNVLELWITASLMDEDLTDLFASLDLLDFDKMDDDCRVFLCTSYDSQGRFRDDNHKELWYKNLEIIKQKYPKLFLHTQIITTQAFLEEVDNGGFSFEKLDKLSGVDYKLPGSFRIYYTDKIKNKEAYPKHLREVKPQFPPKFFVEHRDDFLCFLRQMADFYGAEKLLQFADNKARSMTLISFEDDHTIWDRWSEDNSSENADCGHPYDSYAYLDSNKCARCDAMTLYNMIMEEN